MLAIFRELLKTHLFCMEYAKYHSLYSVKCFQLFLRKMRYTNVIIIIITPLPGLWNSLTPLYIHHSFMGFALVCNKESVQLEAVRVFVHYLTNNDYFLLVFMDVPQFSYNITYLIISQLISATIIPEALPKTFVTHFDLCGFFLPL